ncbi:MAG: M48 family metallopeptidase [Bacteroidales bacterium]|nr:M48 family metallopeptidase [Bacteroidales bacterium]
MQYTGLNTQIRRNNFKSVVLLLLFPAVVFGLIWVFLFFITDQYPEQRLYYANNSFLRLLPWVALGIFLWFIIAYFSHTRLIRLATGSSPLQRTENKRVYNLVENLCIGCGMPMPNINIIEDDSLNAFASGIDNSSYSVSLSRGIISKLNDEELEAVIAHELTHIRNRDVRLLIVSIIFVGIFAFITEALMRTLRYGGVRGGSNNSGRKGSGSIILIALLLAAIGYLLSSIFRFAISRKREYLADAGSAEMTRNPIALASALEKIAVDPRIEAVQRKDVAQLFIDNPQEKQKDPLTSSFTAIFATHPPIEKRIAYLRQF